MLTVPPDYVDLAYSHNHPYGVDLAHVGQGNWRAFRALGISLPDVMAIATGWGRELAGIERPWLCWNVDEEWSLVQQRLVQSVGWTPVVGFDPRVGPPRQTVPGAVVVDFNRELGLPVLYPHFPTEFAFLFCERMAFWHSDLLVRPAKFAAIVERFGQLRDGETAAAWAFVGWRNALSTKKKRYWELLACTTRGASRDQFEKGCGWWCDYWAHPNQRQPALIQARYYWDHGSGIYYWEKREGGHCIAIPERDLREGHFTKIGNSSYRRYREPGALSDARRAMASEIRENFDLVKGCQKLGLERYLEAAPP